MTEVRCELPASSNRLAEARRVAWFHRFSLEGQRLASGNASLSLLGCEVRARSFVDAFQVIYGGRWRQAVPPHLATQPQELLPQSVDLGCALVLLVLILWSEQLVGHQFEALFPDPFVRPEKVNRYGPVGFDILGRIRLAGEPLHCVPGGHGACWQRDLIGDTNGEQQEQRRHRQCPRQGRELIDRDIAALPGGVHILTALDVAERSCSQLRCAEPGALLGKLSDAPVVPQSQCSHLLSNGIAEA